MAGFFLFFIVATLTVIGQSVDGQVMTSVMTPPILNYGEAADVVFTMKPTCKSLGPHDFGFFRMKRDGTGEQWTEVEHATQPGQFEHPDDATIKIYNITYSLEGYFIVGCTLTETKDEITYSPLLPIYVKPQIFQVTATEPVEAVERNFNLGYKSNFELTAEFGENGKPSNIRQLRFYVGNGHYYDKPGHEEFAVFSYNKTLLANLVDLREDGDLLLTETAFTPFQNDPPGTIYSFDLSLKRAVKTVPNKCVFSIESSTFMESDRENTTHNTLAVLNLKYPPQTVEPLVTVSSDGTKCSVTCMVAASCPDSTNVKLAISDDSDVLFKDMWASSGDPGFVKSPISCDQLYQIKSNKKAQFECIVSNSAHLFTTVTLPISDVKGIDKVTAPIPASTTAVPATTQAEITTIPSETTTQTPPAPTKPLSTTSDLVIIKATTTPSNIAALALKEWWVILLIVLTCVFFVLFVGMVWIFCANKRGSGSNSDRSIEIAVRTNGANNVYAGTVPKKAEETAEL